MSSRARFKYDHADEASRTWILAMAEPALLRVAPCAGTKPGYVHVTRGERMLDCSRKVQGWRPP